MYSNTALYKQLSQTNSTISCIIQIKSFFSDTHSRWHRVINAANILTLSSVNVGGGVANVGCKSDTGTGISTDVAFFTPFFTDGETMPFTVGEEATFFTSILVGSTFLTLIPCVFSLNNLVN